MKSFKTLMLGFLLAFPNKTSAETIIYNEKNIGLCRGYGWCPDGFPGASFLRVKTRINNNTFSEFQYGIAFPTILTVKTAFGVQLENSRIGIGVRLYPLSLGPQIQFAGSKQSITLSFEACTGYRLEPIGTLFTIGFRNTK